MNEDVMKRWVAALRSGQYIQARKYLNCKIGMCCLGVLADLYANEFGKEWVREPEFDANVLSMFGEAAHLPAIVAEWAGIEAREDIIGMLPYKYMTSDDREAFQNLANLNDTGSTFAEIADVIEEYWQHL